MQDSAPLRVFISYSHNEEDRSLLDKLNRHLASLTVSRMSKTTYSGLLLEYSHTKTYQHG